MRISLTVIVIMMFLMSCGSQKNSDDLSQPPNIIVIFIDDMGYGDIGPFGSEINETPELGKMAEEGLKFTSFYVNASVCTPSRAGLMTGSYPRRAGLGRGSSERVVLFAGGKKGLHSNEVTIAEMLQEAGYTTGIFGKWHLGDQSQFLPTEHGFDEYFGIPYSNDMWPPNKNQHHPLLPVLHNKQVVDTVETMEDQAQLAYRFTERAVDFIQDNKDQPFFVYLPHAFIHVPRAARPEFMKDAQNVTEAQIEEIDWSTGRIMQTLRNEELDKNTLVFFISDNGGARGTDMGPLRGGKGSLWEGGFRVPALAWWPGKIPAGSVTDEVATAMDLLPTFAKIAGGKVPNDRIIDGYDISGLLINPSVEKSPYKHFFYFRGDSVRGIRSGQWKLIRDEEDRLFNLENDISESSNVADANPDVVEQLNQQIREFEAEIRENSRPSGIADNPRTILPRPGVEGEQAYTPTLLIDK